VTLRIKGYFIKSSHSSLVPKIVLQEETYTKIKTNTMCFVQAYKLMIKTSNHFTLNMLIVYNNQTSIKL